MVNVKLPKTVKLKTYVATTLVLAVLLLASVGYVLTSNGTTVTITPQSYIETASYVIEKIGSMVYAKNGTTGEIEFSDSDASTVIQQAIDALTNGGKIFIKAGTYEIKTTININKDAVTIEGESEKWITVLKSTISNGYIFSIKHATENRIEYVSIRNLMLYSQTRTSGRHGIYIQGARLLTFDSLFFRNLDYGIYVDSSDANKPTRGNIVWRFLAMENMVGAGIKFYGTAVTPEVRMFSVRINADSGSEPTNAIIADKILGQWYDIVIGRTAGNAIDLTDPYQVFMVNPWIEYAGGHGIYLHGTTKYNRILGGLVQNSQYHGVYVDGLDETQIIGLQIRNNGKASAGTYDGIRLKDVDDSIIALNEIYDDQGTKTQNYAIYEEGTSNRNQIYNNRVNGNLQTIHIAGSNTDVYHNRGFFTENSGTATITASTSITFTHGLAGTPDVVLVGWQDTGYGTWSWSANSTHITITVTNSGTYDFSWYAEYKP